MKLKIAFIIVFCIAMYFILPKYLPVRSDPWTYVIAAHNLHDSTMRPILYPLLINISGHIGNDYQIMKLIQALFCAGIFIFTYRIAKSIVPVIMMIIFGAYWLYVPFIMTDLICGFFLVSAYYFLKKKDLLAHLVFIFLACITRPSMAWFFIPEPILVWLTFRDRRKVVISFLFVLVFTQLNSLKNLYDMGRYMQNNSWDYNMNLFLNCDSKILFMLKSLKAHLFGTHWNMFFETIGYYKRDISFLKGSNWVLAVDMFFYFIYAIFYLITFVHIIKKRDWFNIIWLSYFIGETVYVWTMGPRMRLPFEFILFIAFSNFMNERLKEIPLKNS